jgi:hypothetical protein
MSISAPTGASAGRNTPSGYKVRQTPNFTPEMMKLFQSLLGGAQGGASGGLDFLSQLASGDESAFADAEAPAYAAFDKTLGQLGSRFSGLGAMDSSAFQQATSGAAGELSQNLQSQRLGLRQGAIDRLLGLSTSLLGQKPYDTTLEKKRSGWDTAGDIAGIAAKFLPMFL